MIYLENIKQTSRTSSDVFHPSSVIVQLRAGVSKLRSAGQIRPTKLFHPTERSIRQ